MYSFPNLEPVHYSMSSSNCCFLTCIQVSQEADEVVWLSQLLKSFPQLIAIHTVKGFGKVNKAEVDVFLELSCFFDDPRNVCNLISGSSAFSKTSLNIWKFSVHVLLKPDLENFEHYFTSVWDECSCAVVWTFFGIAFLWDWKENWPFPVLWPLLFSKFAGILSSTLSQHHLLALFIVMLPKAHLTSHSRMSGSRWVITPWLSGSRSFCMVLLCIFLVSSASVRSIPFLSFIVPIFAWSVPLVSPIFLKRSLVFPSLLFSFISLHSSLRKAFFLSLLFSGALHSVGYIFPFIPCFFSQIFVRPPQTNTLPSYISFSWEWFWTPPPVLC